MLDPIALNRKSFPGLKDNAFPLPWFAPDQAPSTIKDITEQSITILENLEDEKRKKQVNLLKRWLRLFDRNIGNINIRGAWESDMVGNEYPVAIHPTSVHSRMNAQKSCFTVQGKDNSGLSELLSDRELRKYVIPIEHVESFRSDLQMLGITYTTVFPDLDNLAKELSSLF